MKNVRARVISATDTSHIIMLNENQLLITQCFPALCACCMYLVGILMKKNKIIIIRLIKKKKKTKTTLIEDKCKRVLIMEFHRKETLKQIKEFR